MPRTYIRKSNKKRLYGYCGIDNLNRSVEAVWNDMLMRKAAIEFDVKCQLCMIV